MVGPIADGEDGGEMPSPRGDFRPDAAWQLAALCVALVAWGWLLSGLRHRPTELATLVAAIPILAMVGQGIARFAGPSRSVAGVAATAVVGFTGLIILTGANPLTLLCFAFGLLKPAAWQGDHLLLRVIPLAMVAAHPLRPSWPMAVVSALGVTAFLGIALLILGVAA